MTHIRNNKHPIHRYLAVFAVASTPVLAGMAHAETRLTDIDMTLAANTVTVKGERQKFKTDSLSSPKYTQPLLDTPQTITVISSELIEEQGAVTLMQALRNTPGITAQLGENGNTSAGDTFQMRGFSAQTATFVDGIRDLGAVTRDTFNIEQIEIAKGPAGSDIGRGASSGYINLVSKTPKLKNSSTASLGISSEGGNRLSADVNHALGETSAFRLNLMTQDLDTPGRRYINNASYGIAPSFALGLGTDTRFYILAQHIKQDNLPEGGVPTIGQKGYFNTSALYQAGARVNTKNFYGSVNDFEDVEANMLTTRFEHDLKGGWRLSNASRIGRTSMDRVVTGVNALGTTIGVNPDTWTVTRTRQGTDQVNEIIANQTNLVGAFKTGSIEHDLSTGMEIMYERQLTSTLAITNLPTTGLAANLYAPNTNDVMPEPYHTGPFVDGHTTTVSFYGFDTVKLSEQWQLTGGLRLDNYQTETENAVLKDATKPNIDVLVSRATANGVLTSWKLGALYKPAENASLYVAFGNSLTPPGGANFALSTTTSNIANASFDPQETFNSEIGGKWDALKGKLALTAAWYETTHKNELTQADPLNPTSFVQTGERKVSGIELGAVGQLTKAWQVSAGIATLHTKVTEGTTANNAAGAAARWSPELTATLWTSYTVRPGFELGGGVRYISDQKREVNPTVILAQSSMPEIRAYSVVDAMASFALTRSVGLRLNLYNLLDETYIATLNNSGARMTPGAPRSGMLTLSMKF